MKAQDDKDAMIAFFERAKKHMIVPDKHSSSFWSDWYLINLHVGRGTVEHTVEVMDEQGKSVVRLHYRGTLEVEQTPRERF